MLSPRALAVPIALAATALAAPSAHAVWTYEELGAAAAPGSGKSVVYATTRSSSTSKPVGDCGTRLQCIRAAIKAANVRTMWSVASVSAVKVDGWNPATQTPTSTFVDLSRLGGVQAWQAPNVDMGWKGDHDGISEFDAGLDRISYGGTTSFRGGLDGVRQAFRHRDAHPTDPRVTVFIADRTNIDWFGRLGDAKYDDVKRWAGYGLEGSVIRAFAVGSGLDCDDDPNGIGSLDDVAAVTPGGTCQNVTFAGLADAIAGAITPLPPAAT
jgi:hypothetical protein